MGGLDWIGLDWIGLDWIGLLSSNSSQSARDCNENANTNATAHDAIFGTFVLYWVMLYSTCLCSRWVCGVCMVGDVHEVR